MNPTNHPATRVIFFSVRNAQSKLKIIHETVQMHFEKKQPILILVEDAKAQEFVDELLWKFPDTSFLPHVATDLETKDFIAITKTKTNVNDAKLAFNLCSTPLVIATGFHTVYEFEDLSHPHKNKLSQLRFDAYKKAKFLIESRSVSAS